MFNSRIEVDKHVENSLRKIHVEAERVNRYISFAKLYFNIGEYEIAKRYITTYLSTKQKSAEGHNLLGRILEKSGKKEAALEAYRTSLNIDPKQNNLVLKVCELLACEEVPMDQAGAKQYCEMAQNLDPYSTSVTELKERLILTANNNPDDITKLLLQEIEVRPMDCKLRVKFLRHLLQINKVNDAYNHLSEVESKNWTSFSQSSIWYEVVAEVLIKYQKDSSNSLSWQYWFLLISVMDKIVFLNLDELADNLKNTRDYIKALFNFDQTLKSVSEKISSCPDRKLVEEFLKHYEAQLCLHFVTVIFKQAKKDLIRYRDVVQITLPILFAAYHLSPIDLNSSWVNHVPETAKHFVQRWQQEASFRCSQVGHILLALAGDSKSSIIQKANQYSTGMWREQVFKKIFVLRDQQIKMNSSCFVTTLHLLDPTLKLPEKSDLLKYDEFAQLVYPNSLHHYIWLTLNNEISDINYITFEGLQYSIKNLNNCSAESLNILDIHAFIYCSTLCAQSNLKHLEALMVHGQEKLTVFPVSITNHLGTIVQSKFIKAAYKMYKNEQQFDFGAVRLTLIQGIEIIRCVGHHGLQVGLLVNLAEIFAKRASLLSKQSEIEYNNARAELYWKTALPLLEKLKNNQTISYPPNRWFEYKSREFSFTEIQTLIDKGKLFIGMLLMKRKDFDKATVLFEDLKDPYASFYQAQIYKQMADKQLLENKDDMTNEMKSQLVALLLKSRDSLYLTLDRLRDPSCDKKHPLDKILGTEIEKIEKYLAKFDYESANYDYDNLSDDLSYMVDYTFSPNVTYDNAHQRTPKHNISRSTPFKLDFSRREARPSPERLDAQLRQLVNSQDTALNHILEQNRVMLESHRQLVDEVRGLKDHTYSNPVLRQEFTDLKKSVDDHKQSTEERLRYVTDLVYELKKEIADLRKDAVTAKPSQNQLNDLFPLDDDYSDNYASSTMNLYSNANFHNKAQQPPVPPPALYPGAMYPGFFNPMNPYGYPSIPNLNVPPPNLPYGQISPEFRSLMSGYLHTPGDAAYPQQSLSQSHLPMAQTASLPNTGINAGMFAGQNLTQTASQPIVSVKQSTPLSNVSVPSSVASNALPVNVVITTSDPLPTPKPTVSQVLSVTIPPQHIKGNQNKSQPHNYQIPLTTTSTPTLSSLSSFLQTSSLPSVTDSLLANIPSPIYSPNTATGKNVTLGLHIEKSLELAFKQERTLSEDDLEAKGGKVIYSATVALFEPCSHDSTKWIQKSSGSLMLVRYDPKGEKCGLLMVHGLNKIHLEHDVAKGFQFSSSDGQTFTWTANNLVDRKGSFTFQVRFHNLWDGEGFKNELAKLNGSSGTFIQLNDQKTTLGGFSFSKSPSFQSKGDVVATETITNVSEEEPKANPFAAFKFESSKLQASTFTPPNASIESKKITPKTPGVGKEHDENSFTDDFVSTAEFKPLIPLPDLVDVKTGEEGAEVLFESRAKLFRLDSSGEKKEWKERGLGMMKVLKNDIIRLIMRREQVLKVCCNHQVLKDMVFALHSQSAKSVTWCAKDFSEGVVESETFNLKFKTEEIAAEFLKCVKDAQSLLDDKGFIKSSRSGKQAKMDQSPKHGFGDKFKASKGSWGCKNCFVVNEPKAHTCIACGSSKNPSSPDKSSSTEVSGPTFSFGTNTTSSATSGNVSSTSGWGEAYKPQTGSWECKGCYTRNSSDKLYCLACDAPKDDTVPKKEEKPSQVNLETGMKFTFGINATTPKTESQNTASFKFNQSENTPDTLPKSKTLFDIKPSSTSSGETPKDNSNNFVFGSAKTHAFEFTPKSPRRVSTGQGEEESDTSYLEEEADNIYFKPIIPLPEKIELKTGEEDEDVLYSHRAKLFKFTNGEWKERGLGDVKILKNRTNGKIRVLMRREQVFKICLNHVLTENVKYEAKDEKTWLFHAADYSDEELCQAQFCLRFKDAEIASDFLKAVNNILSDNKTSTSQANEDDSDDSSVVLVSATEVTPEEEEQARKLQLPRLFFAYKKLPYCTCSQCSRDDEFYQDVKDKDQIGMPQTSKQELKVKNLQSLIATPKLSNSPLLKTPLLKTPVTEFYTPNTNSNSSSTPSNIFSTPMTCKTDDKFFTPAVTATTAGSLFGSKAEATKTDTPAFSFINKQPTGSFLRQPHTAASTVSIFSQPDTPTTFSSTSATSEASPSQSGSLFSQSSTPNISGNLFSQPNTPTTGNLFGQPNTSATTGNLFGQSSTPGTAVNLFSKPDTPATPVNLFSQPGTPVTTGNLFGQSGTPATIGNLFGQPGTPTTTGNLFGQPSTPTMSGSLFGQPANPTSTGSLFGQTTTSASTGSIFAQTATSSNGSIFTQTTTPNNTGSIFGQTATPSSGSIFGQTATPSSTGSIFGTSSSVFGSTTASTDSPSLFGPPKSSFFGAGNLFGTPKENVNVANPIFGGSSSRNTATSATPLFGTTLNNANSSKQEVNNERSKDDNVSEPKTELRFADLANNASKTESTEKTDATKPTLTSNLKEGDELVLKTSSSVTFASLASAAKDKDVPAFAKSTEGGATKPFLFSGAGSRVFESFSKDAPKTSVSKETTSQKHDETQSGDENETEGEHDPHFEPIVPLPALIQVSTGEEEEEVLFNERAKLYRHTDSQWKERGVGQMKILHNPKTGTHRFLLRREQVHKLVLNQLITPNLDVQQMKMSDNAWMWAGHNYCEDEPALETLCVKFKNSEIAQQFYDAYLKVKNSIAESPQSPASVGNGENEEEEYEDDEDYDEEGLDSSIIYKTGCTLEEFCDNKWSSIGDGSIQICYDPEIFCAKIIFITNDGELVNHSTIGTNTVVEVDGSSCTWKAVETVNQDYRWRHLKATFKTEMEAEIFHMNYLEGYNYAEQVGMVDEMPLFDET